MKWNQVLAKYKIDAEKFECLEIDQRKDMDEIQAYMKKVKFKYFQRPQLNKNFSWRERRQFLEFSSEGAALVEETKLLLLISAQNFFS